MNNNIFKITVVIMISFFIAYSSYAREVNYLSFIEQGVNIESTEVKLSASYNGTILDAISYICRGIEVSKIENREKTIAIYGYENSIKYEVIIDKSDLKNIYITACISSNKDESRYLKSFINDKTSKWCDKKSVTTLIKGKADSNNIDKAIKRMNLNLIDANAKDIENIAINSGISGVAKINDKQVNYAICKYDTGVYVLIGDPVICETY